jgi:hypothetical protein
MLEVSGGLLTRVEIRRFEFDHEEAIRRVETMGEFAEPLVQRLRTGRA